MNGGDLPALAASTLVAAAMTDVWATARDGFASVFGQGGPDPVAASELDATRDELTSLNANLGQARSALEEQWAARLTGLLDSRPDAEAELRRLVADIWARLPVRLASISLPARKSRFGFLRHVSPILGIVSGVLFLAGFMFIGFYAASNPGPYLGYLSAGWLAACAAFVTGCLAGLVLGIPRFVSSGALRHDVEARRPPVTPISHTQVSALRTGEQTTVGESGQDQVSRFTPSTNLAEISDWLTKLLLGAGLVGLTRLGRPLGALVDMVARGLGSATPSGPSKVIAAAILATYVVLGFLDGYVVTTLWYGKHLQQLGYE
jgi:hypothetical protein